MVIFHCYVNVYQRVTDLATDRPQSLESLFRTGRIVRHLGVCGKDPQIMRLLEMKVKVHIELNHIKSLSLLLLLLVCHFLLFWKDTPHAEGAE
jgi:hypothetical protein